MSNFLTRLYRILLYLYPRSFRTKFCEEMASVFAEKAGEGQVQTQIALHFLRELLDLPGSIINIYTSTWTQG